MTIWETLGIEPTGDARAIKKAYARQSRNCHPEEAPEEFQRLHAAFQEALRRAVSLRAVGGYNPATNKDNTSRKVYFDPDLVMPKPIGQTEAPLWVGPRLHFDEVERAVEGREALPDFDRLIAQGLEQKRAPLEETMRGLQTLHDNPQTKNDPLAWRAFLKASAFYDLRHDTEFLARLAQFLTEQGDVPNDVWLTFCAAYNFSDPNQRDEAHRELFELLLPRYRRAANALHQEKMRKRNQKIKWAATMVLTPIAVALFAAWDILWLPVFIAYFIALFAVPSHFHWIARVHAARRKQQGIIGLCCAVAAVALVLLANLMLFCLTPSVTIDIITVMIYCAIVWFGGFALLALQAFFQNKKC